MGLEIIDIMEYTFNHLKKVVAAYDKNFLKTENATGPEKAKHQRRESRLNNLSIKIRKSLGILSKDPCGTRRCIGKCVLSIEKRKCELLIDGHNYDVSKSME